MPRPITWELFPILAAALLMAASFFLPDATPAAVLDETPVRTLIIDAGHGGEDGGASSAGGVHESAVNLEIALRLEALAGLFGERTVMTRRVEHIEYPADAITTAQRKKADQNARLRLINSCSNAVLISIHQNSFPDPRPSGSQVLFGAADGSKALAALAHETLRAAICPDNRRVASSASDSIYLMREAKCTAILVECGFLSNNTEAECLISAAYQMKIAAALYSSYLSYCAAEDGMVT